jgi:hypothetical protein
MAAPLPPEPNPADFVPADGPTTRGITIAMGKRSVKLPDHVQVNASIFEVTCLAGLPCPETPIVVLEDTHNGEIIAVSLKTGKIEDNTALSPEDNRKKREVFKWLVQQLENNGK